MNLYNSLNKKFGFNAATGGSNGNPYKGKTDEEMDSIRKLKSDNGSIKIICTTTRQIYKSITVASKIFNCDEGRISKCCRGKAISSGKDFITGEALQWMYYTDYLKTDEEEIKSKVKPTKKIICINTGEIFNDAFKASEKLYCTRENVYACIHGTRKYCGINPETKEKFVCMRYEDYLKISTDIKYKKQEEKILKFIEVESANN